MRYVLVSALSMLVSMASPAAGQTRYTSPDGKLDRAALPAPTAPLNIGRSEYMAQIDDIMAKLDVRPVLTAHPTESTRRTLLALQARVAGSPTLERVRKRQGWPGSWYGEARRHRSRAK